MERYYQMRKAHYRREHKDMPAWKLEYSNFWLSRFWLSLPFYGKQLQIKLCLNSAVPYWQRINEVRVLNMDIPCG
jgi:hypothetical protein